MHAAPESIKAAATLKEQDSPVVLVKVDATVQEKSGEKYQVQGYPTLKWFKNGEESEYQGGRTAAEIVAWINKKSGPPALDVVTVAAAEKTAKTADVTVLGVFADKEGAEATAFIEVASAMDLSFIISTSDDVATHYSTKAPGVRVRVAGVTCAYTSVLDVMIRHHWALSSLTLMFLPIVGCH